MMWKRKSFFFLFLFILFEKQILAKSEDRKEKEREDGLIVSYVVDKTFPHDSSAFTQGIFLDPFDPSYFYEGTGMYGESALRKVNVGTGKVWKQRKIDQRHFGEGIAFHKGNIYQLTWREKFIYRYSMKESNEWVKKKREIFKGPGFLKEGWGLTSDGNYLIASEGTSKLYFFTIEEGERDSVLAKTLTVKLNEKPISLLNELEYIGGYIWANVWYSTRIYIIDPQTGKVVLFIEAENLKTTGDVLNGIAYDPSNDLLYLTGKYWPNVYSVRLICSNGKIPKPISDIVSICTAHSWKEDEL